MLMPMEAGDFEVPLEALLDRSEDLGRGRFRKSDRGGLVIKIHGDVLDALDGFELALHLRSARRASGHAGDVHHDLGFTDRGGDRSRLAMAATADERGEGQGERKNKAK